MRIHKKQLPDIKDQFQIEVLIAADGYVYIKNTKGMYGLDQASIKAHNQLISHMESHGYYPVPLTTGLCSQNTRKTKFAYVWMTPE